MSYAKPMPDISLDLSISMPDDVIEIDPSSFDCKGWTVYTQDGEARTELEPDGFGSFLGIELGQTFYYSRTMEEKLESPTLQIIPINRSVSVWLDDALIYTDQPELDNRIGYVTLPMLEWDREEPITISLPPDYQGKTLTIAQSFPEYSEASSVRAMPCEVKLYCGYAYESQLISESFLLAIVSVAAFVVGAYMLFAFVRHKNISLLCLGMVAFFWMALKLRSASFFWQYFGVYKSTFDPVISPLIACVLLVFLALRAGKRREILWIIIAACALSIAAQLICLLPTFSSIFHPLLNMCLHLPYWIAMIGFLTDIGMGWVLWRKESPYYRMFLPTAAALIVGYWLISCWTTGPSTLLSLLKNSMASGQVDFIYHKTLPPFMIAALLTAIIETIQKEINLRTEKRLLHQRYEMMQASYEGMRLQHEEVMMLRHDMAKHFRILHGMDSEEARTAYLGELLGQNERIHPVFQSGNKIIDIIISSSMRMINESGITFEVVRSAAPEKLPLSDADLCSMMMNLMDNAVHAAATSGEEKPVIRLDLHIKNDFFVFTCRNSANTVISKDVQKEETVPKHGLGLKIAHQIAEKNGVLIEREYGSDYYEVTLIVPLNQAFR